MASIKQLGGRRFKITVSNGYRPDGKKICKAKDHSGCRRASPSGVSGSM